MNLVAQSRPVLLTDNRGPDPCLVPATLVRGLASGRVRATEEEWSPARAALVLDTRRAGLVLENGHGDWRRKLPYVERGDLFVIAVECEGAVQGMMALPAIARFASLTPGSEAVYIDYIESAPWNVQIELAQDVARFTGVGQLLVGEAIRVSTEQGHGGRVGLHSLEQAEQF